MPTLAPITFTNEYKHIDIGSSLKVTLQLFGMNKADVLVLDTEAMAQLMECLYLTPM